MGREGEEEGRARMDGDVEEEADRLGKACWEKIKGAGVFLSAQTHPEVKATNHVLVSSVPDRSRPTKRAGTNASSQIFLL